MFRKTTFFETNPNFQYFEKNSSFSRSLQQICYVEGYLKKLGFFSKNPSIPDKKNKFWTFLELLLVQSVSTAFFLRLKFSSSERNLIFCFEKPFFLWRKTKFEGFEKVYFSSRFLKQNCYFQRFWKIWVVFFEKPVFFPEKQSKVGTLWVLLLPQSLFTEVFLRLTFSRSEKV